MRQLKLPCHGIDPDLYEPEVLKFLQQNPIKAPKLVSINVEDLLGSSTFNHPMSEPAPNVARLAESVAFWMVDALKTHAEKVFRQVTVGFSED